MAQQTVKYVVTARDTKERTYISYIEDDIDLVSHVSTALANRHTVISVVNVGLWPRTDH